MELTYETLRSNGRLLARVSANYSNEKPVLPENPVRVNMAGFMTSVKCMLSGTIRSQFHASESTQCRYSESFLPSPWPSSVPTPLADMHQSPDGIL